MSVRKRKWTTRSGEEREAWVVDYTDADGDRHIETFSCKKDADARSSEVDMHVRTGVHVAASKSMTVAKAAEVWIEACTLDELERATVSSYRGHVDNHIVPALGRVKLCDLTVADVQAFSNGLRKTGASQAMVRKITAWLGSMLTVAHNRGLVARNVVRDIGRKRTKGETRRKERIEVGTHIPGPGRDHSHRGACQGTLAAIAAGGGFHRASRLGASRAALLGCRSQGE